MDAVEFANLEKLQNTHWWHVSRKEIIKNTIAKLNLPQNPKILEVGCGMGGNLQMLCEIGDVYACEYNLDALEYSKKLGITKNIQHADLPNKPAYIDEKFDLIVMFDVLEHIKDDSGTISTLSKQLKPNGKIMITVPALMSLWSQHDVICHHQRRYVKQTLRNAFATENITEEFCCYYNFFLFPAVFFVRMLQKLLPSNTKVAQPMQAPKGFINKILKFIFSAEKWLLPKPGFPIGVSIIACFKTSTNS